MLEEYANQSLTLAKHGTISDCGEYPYTSTSTISGRKETGIKIVKNQYGQEVVSTSTVFTETDIDIDDKIDGDIVIAIDDAVDLDGVVLFNMAYLQ